MAICNQTLTSIATGCDSNRGGLSTELILWNRKQSDGTLSATTITVDDTSKVITTLSLASGVTPTKFEFRKQSSSATSTFTNDDANGISFVQTDIALRFARQDAAKRLAITTLLRSEVQGIYKDANGQYWFIGFDDPVTCTAGGAETGTSSTDPNQYTVTLTDLSKDLPYSVQASVAETLFA